MRRFKLTMTSVAMLSILMMFTASFVFAEGNPVQVDEQKDVTAEKILVDVFLLRPVGVLATAFGVATYLVTLPLTAALNSHEIVGRKLVGNPWDFTFKRPVGQIK